MVSRRKILNRSRDDLSADHEEEDIWYQKDKLFKVSQQRPIVRRIIANYFAISVGRFRVFWTVLLFVRISRPFDN
jgi:hypothetical protein